MDNPETVTAGNIGHIRRRQHSTSNIGHTRHN